MCSSILQCIFGIVLSISFILLLVAAVTPGWQTFYVETKDAAASGHSDTAQSTVNVGIFWKDCASHIKNCTSEVWKTMKGWERATVILLLLSLALCLAAMVWSCLTSCTCCLKPLLIWPLPILTTLAFLLSGVAMVLYISKTTSLFSDLKNVNDLNSLGEFADELAPNKLSKQIGYSMYLGFIGSAGLLVASILGCVIVKVS